VVAAEICTGESTVAPFRGVQMVTDGFTEPGVQPPVDPLTVILTVDLNIRPMLSCACTVTRCGPAAIASDVLKVLEAIWYFFTPSTYICINVTGCESVVPAEMATGEPTVAPSLGVQIVTEGSVGFRGQGAA